MGEWYIFNLAWPYSVKHFECRLTNFLVTPIDRLVGVPNVQPPLPIDCLPRATHPVNHTPYIVAHYWDKSVRDCIEEKTSRLQAARKHQQLQSGSATGIG